MKKINYILFMGLFLISCFNKEIDNIILSDKLRGELTNNLWKIFEIEPKNMYNIDDFNKGYISFDLENRQVKYEEETIGEWLPTDKQFIRLGNNIKRNFIVNFISNDTIELKSNEYSYNKKEKFIPIKLYLIKVEDNLSNYIHFDSIWKGEKIVKDTIEFNKDLFD